jgi:acyl-[acyl-carrier-protein] desaturase
MWNREERSNWIGRDRRAQMTQSINRKAYQVYLDFLETAEKKRRWSMFDDIPWDALDAAKASEGSAQSVEIYCAEELYVPDYSAKGLELVRSRFGVAWFQTCWAFEESRHGLVFREYLTRSGMRSETEIEDLEASVFAKSWKLPFETTRQMACYGALQEGATYVAYKLQKDRARCAGDSVLETIYHLVGRDEAAHGGFYRALIELELSEDRAATIADLAEVLSDFKMPGDGLIAN